MATELRDEEAVDLAPMFSVRVFNSFKDAEIFRDAWDDLVTRTGTDIYQTFDWCQIWWRHYGKGRRIELFLGFSDERLVGVLPIFVEVLWLGPARIRVAKLVGADFSLQFCNPAIEADYFRPLMETAVRRCFRECSCDLLLIGPLSGPSAKVSEVLSAALSTDELVQEAVSLGTGCAIRFELPSDFAGYWKEIGSRQRANYSRALKQFATSCSVETEVVSGPREVRSEFARFTILHEAQWRQEGKLGHFGDWPRATAFNRDLVESFSSLGKVRFFRILADGEVASSQYSFIHHGVHYWRLPARACKPEWEKLSLGKMGLVNMVKDSIREGIAAIEAGRGYYDYKLQLGGREWPLRTVQIMRRGSLVRLRVRIFRTFAVWLNLIYYRVYFTRIAPRFPWLQGSLWSTWIRSTW